MKRQISDMFGDIRLVHRKTMKVKVGSTPPLREAGSSAAPRFNPSHAMQPSYPMQAIQCGFYGTMFRQAQLKLINPYALTPTLSIERF